MESEINGPFSYRNWKADMSGQPWDMIFEFPLLTDAHFIGEVTEGLGPYQILNADPIPPHSWLVRPALTLRAKSHLKLTIPVMDKTFDDHYTGGFESDEIAALLSLCLGVRLKAGSPNRSFRKDGDPMGRPQAYGFLHNPTFAIKHTYRRPILKSALGSHSLLEAYTLLTSFPLLLVENATALVRAALMYQEAIWIIESTPELSWIMLTSAIETVANQWDTTKASPIDIMRKSKLGQDLENILREYGGDKGDELVQKIAKKLSRQMGATRKFVDFINEFLPPEPPRRPSQNAQHPWSAEAMEETMSKIYDYRSRALHGGHPFPSPMCSPSWVAGEQGELAEIPLGLATEIMGTVWVAKDTPLLLHTFEYIVRNAILKWWNSVVPENPSEIA